MVDAKNTRRLPAVPVVDSVPLMVCWESKVTVVTPAVDGAVTEKLLNVFEPLTIRDPATVEVNEMLLNVKLAPAIPEIAALLPTKVEVPALRVIPVEVKLKAFAAAIVAVMVLEPRLTDRVLVPVEANCIAVTL